MIKLSLPGQTRWKRFPTNLAPAENRFVLAKALMMTNVVTFQAVHTEPAPSGPETEATALAGQKPSLSPEVLALAKSRIQQALALLDHALGSAREIEARLGDTATRQQFGEHVANMEDALQVAVRRMRQL